MCIHEERKIFYAPGEKRNFGPHGPLKHPSLLSQRLYSKPETEAPPSSKSVNRCADRACGRCCASASPSRLAAGEQHSVRVVPLRCGQRVESDAPQRVDHTAHSVETGRARCESSIRLISYDTRSGHLYLNLPKQVRGVVESNPVRSYVSLWTATKDTHGVHERE